MTAAKDAISFANTSFLMEAAARNRMAEVEKLFAKDTSEPSEEASGKVGVLDELQSWRAERLNQLKTMRNNQRYYMEQGHGTLEEFTDEKQIIDLCNSKARVLCHFYHPEFTRCKQLDQLLTLLASKHLETKFIKIQAAKAQFFTHKLGLQVLPTLMSVIDGKVAHIFLGFEEFKGDAITAESLRNALLKHRAITQEENVLLEMFKKAANGNSRIPLKVAVNELCKFLPLGGDNQLSKSETFMNELYTRHVDKRAGLNAHVLMVGGPKNIRGNPRGGVDARLHFPQVTFEQFYRIAREMESIAFEQHVPHISGGRLHAAGSTLDVLQRQKRHYEAVNEEITSTLGVK